jgi:tRNA-dihydrouridine synthase B
LLQIGSIKLKNRVVAAPMAGITDQAFRLILKAYGCGMVYTEMISGKALCYGQGKTLAMCAVAEEEPPVAVQLFGSEPDTMARAARMVVEQGAALVDINMGCPTLKIVKNGEGAALMKDPELAAQIVAAVVAVVAVPVTVKLRAGWDRDNINCCQVARLVQEAGAAAVTIHARTREQFYSGQADWELIRQVKELLTIPVIGNGDIWSAADAGRMFANTGCDAVMIARGSLGNPFIFREVLHYLQHGDAGPPPTIQERLDTVRAHLDLVCRLKGEARGIPEMRKHLAWYIKGLPYAAAARVRINQVATRQEIEQILEDIAHKS